MRYAVALCVGVLSATVAGQSPSAAPRFEVASIKRSPDALQRVVAPVPTQTLPGGVWRARDVSLGSILLAQHAGRLTRAHVIGGPDWMWSDWYDIEARAAAPASAEDVHAMVRALLADRFGLVTHVETQERPGFVLNIRPGRALGAGFSKPAVDCAAFRAGGERPQDPTRKPYGDRLSCASTLVPVFPHTLSVPGATIRLTAGDVPVAAITTLLTNQLGRQVVDGTGLSQRFDIELQFSSSGPAIETTDRGPSLQTAIREQLGLQLDDARFDVEMLVVDRVHRPSEN